MRLSERDKKAERDRYAVGPSPAAADYPRGMHLSLGEPELKKLGIDGMPKVGDVYSVEGEMKVTAVEGRDSENAQSTRRADVVLRRFGAEPKERAEGGRDTSIREDLEAARHQAGGDTARAGRLGARFANGRG